MKSKDLIQLSCCFLALLWIALASVEYSEAVGFAEYGSIKSACLNNDPSTDDPMMYQAGDNFIRKVNVQTGAVESVVEFVTYEASRPNITTIACNTDNKMLLVGLDEPLTVRLMYGTAFTGNPVSLDVRAAAKNIMLLRSSVPTEDYLGSSIIFVSGQAVLVIWNGGASPGFLLDLYASDFTQWYEDLPVSLSEYRGVIAHTGYWNENSDTYVGYLALNESAAILPIEIRMLGSPKLAVAPMIYVGLGQFETATFISQDILVSYVVFVSSFGGASMGLKLSLERKSSPSWEYVASVEQLFFHNGDIVDGHYDQITKVFYFLLDDGGILKMDETLSDTIWSESPDEWSGSPSPYTMIRSNALFVSVQNNLGFYSYLSPRKRFALTEICSKAVNYFDFGSNNELNNATTVVDFISDNTATLSVVPVATPSENPEYWGCARINGGCLVSTDNHIDNNTVDSLKSSNKLTIMFEVRTDSLAPNEDQLFFAFNRDGDVSAINSRISLSQPRRTSDLTFQMKWKSTNRYPETVFSDVSWTYSNFFDSTSSIVLGAVIFEGANSSMSDRLGFTASAYRNGIKMGDPSGWWARAGGVIKGRIWSEITNYHLQSGEKTVKAKDLVKTDVKIDTNCYGGASEEFKVPYFIDEIEWTSRNQAPAAYDDYSWVYMSHLLIDSTESYTYCQKAKARSSWVLMKQDIDSTDTGYKENDNGNGGISDAEDLCEDYWETPTDIDMTSGRHDLISVYENRNCDGEGTRSFDSRLKGKNEPNARYVDLGDSFFSCGFGVNYDLATYTSPPTYGDGLPKWNSTSGVTQVITGGFLRAGLDPHPPGSPAGNDYLVHYYGYFHRRHDGNLEHRIGSCDGIILEIDGNTLDFGNDHTDHQIKHKDRSCNVISGTYSLCKGYHRFDLWTMGYRFKNIHYWQVLSSDDHFFQKYPWCDIVPADAFDITHAFDEPEIDWDFNMFSAASYLGTNYDLDGDIYAIGVFADSLTTDELGAVKRARGCKKPDIHPELMEKERYGMFSLTNCSSFADCKSCVASSSEGGDPSCSWCTISSSCEYSVTSSCSNLVTTCPSLDFIQPTSGHNTGGYVATIRGNHFFDGMVVDFEHTKVEGSGNINITSLTQADVLVPDLSAFSVSEVDVKVLKADYSDYTNSIEFSLLSCSSARRDAPCGFCITSQAWTVSKHCPADSFILSDRPTMTSASSSTSNVFPVRDEMIEVEIEGQYLSWPSHTVQCNWTVNGQSYVTTASDVAGAPAGTKITCSSPSSVPACSGDSCEGTVFVQRYDGPGLIYPLVEETEAVNFYDCGQHTDCLTCSYSDVQASFCGWCHADGTCQTWTACSNAGATLHDNEFVQHDNGTGECIQLNGPSPVSLPLTGSHDVVVTLDDGQLVPSETYRCHFEAQSGGADYYSSLTQDSITQVTCHVSNAGSVFSGAVTGTDLNIEVDAGGSGWKKASYTGSSFLFYDCDAYDTCDTCSSNSRPLCDWCLEDASCVISNGCSGTYGDACPSVVSATLDPIGKDISSSIVVSGSKFVDDVRCKFYDGSTTIYSSSVSISGGRTELTCNFAGLNAAGTWTISVHYTAALGGELYAPQTLSMNVIDCASYTDCGDCIDASIGCGFDRSTMECAPSGGTFFSTVKSVACPVVFDHNPKIASLNDNTSITVEFNSPPPTSPALIYYWISEDSGSVVKTDTIPSPTGNQLVIEIESSFANKIEYLTLGFNTSGGASYVRIYNAVQIYTCASLSSACGDCFASSLCGWCGDECKANSTPGCDKVCPQVNGTLPVGQSCDSPEYVIFGFTSPITFITSEDTCRYTYVRESVTYTVDTAIIDNNSSYAKCTPPPRPSSGSGIVTYSLDIARSSRDFTDGSSTMFTTYDCSFLSGVNTFTMYEECLVAEAGSTYDCYWDPINARCQYSNGSVPSSGLPQLDGFVNLTGIAGSSVFVDGKYSVPLNGSNLGQNAMSDLYLQVGSTSPVYVPLTWDGDNLFVDLPSRLVGVYDVWLVKKLNNPSVPYSPISQGINATLTYFDCDFSSCTSCLGALNDDCGWCWLPGASACMDESTCHDLYSGKFASNSTGGNEDEISCPALVALEPLEARVDQAFNVSIVGTNFPPDESRYRCAFDFVDSTSVMNVTLDSSLSGNDSILCLMSASAASTEKGMSVSVYYDDEVFVNQLSFDIFDCASITTCSSCLSRAICGWCFASPGGCETSDQCSSGWSNTYCPSFLSIAPDSGAQDGGTNVTLTGENFVAGLVCELIDQRVNATFINSTMIVCEIPEKSYKTTTSTTHQLKLLYNVDSEEHPFDPTIPASDLANQRFTYYSCFGSSCTSCVTSSKPECGWCLVGGVTPDCTTLTGCSSGGDVFAQECPVISEFVPDSAPIGVARNITVKGELIPNTGSDLVVVFGSYDALNTLFVDANEIVASSPAAPGGPDLAAITTGGILEYDAKVYTDANRTDPHGGDSVGFLFYNCESPLITSIDLCVNGPSQKLAFYFHTMNECGWCLSTGSCLLESDPDSKCAGNITSGWWVPYGNPANIPTTDLGTITPSSSPIEGNLSVWFTTNHLPIGANYFIEFKTSLLSLTRKSRRGLLAASPNVVVPATVVSLGGNKQNVSIVSPSISISTESVGVSFVVAAGINSTSINPIIDQIGMTITYYDCSVHQDCSSCNVDGGELCGWCGLTSSCGLASACSAPSPFITDVGSCAVIGDLSTSRGSTHGNTPVLIEGSNFLNISSIMCDFGGSLSNATFINDTFIECKTPSRDGASITSLKLRSDGRMYAYNTGTFKFYDCEANIDSCSNCMFPTREDCGFCRTTSMCTVDFKCPNEISNNFVQDKANCPAITSISPTRGSSYGGTVLTIRGTNFVDGLFCRFNETLVPSTFDNVTEEIKCTSPNDSNAGSIDVSLYGLKRDLVVETYESYSVDPKSFTFYSCPSSSLCTACLVTDQSECVWYPGMADCTVSAFVPGGDASWSGGVSNCPTMTNYGPRDGLLDGGDIITINSNVFAQGVTLYCNFGSRRVQASYVNPTTIRCNVPSVDDEGDVELSVTYADGTPYFDTKGTYFYYENTKSTPVAAIVVGTLTPFILFGWMAHDLIFNVVHFFLTIFTILILIRILIMIRRRYKRYKFYKQLRPPNWNEVIFKKDLNVLYNVSGREHLLDQIDDVIRNTDARFVQSIVACADSAEADSLSKYLCYLFETENESAPLLKSIIRDEVERTKDVSILFRTNSIATKMFKTYSSLYGLEYLFATLSKPIFLLSLEHKDSKKDSEDKRLASFSQIGQKSVDMEVDGSKRKTDDGEDSSASENMSKFGLLLTCQEFLSTITKSLPTIPFELRDVLESVKVDSMARFGDEHATVVAIGGFFFLRFMCPAVMTPEAHGLLKQVPSAKLRRHLTLITKVLQNLANGVEFQKEAYMIKMNDFITTNLKQIERFMIKVASTPIRDKHDRLKVRSIPDSARTNSICFLYNFLVEKKKKILLDAKKRVELAMTSVASDITSEADREMPNEYDLDSSQKVEGPGAAVMAVLAREDTNESMTNESVTLPTTAPPPGWDDISEEESGDDDSIASSKISDVTDDDSDDDDSSEDMDTPTIDAPGSKGKKEEKLEEEEEEEEKEEEEEDEEEEGNVSDDSYAPVLDNGSDDDVGDVLLVNEDEIDIEDAQPMVQLDGSEDDGVGMFEMNTLPNDIDSDDEGIRIVDLDGVDGVDDEEEAASDSEDSLLDLELDDGVVRRQSIFSRKKKNDDSATYQLFEAYFEMLEGKVGPRFERL